MGIPKNKILEFNMKYLNNCGEQEKNNKIISFIDTINNNEFQFNIEEDDLSKINELIDFIIKNIDRYDELKMNIDEKVNDEISTNFMKKIKDIWEKEFKDIKEFIRNKEISEN